MMAKSHRDTSGQVTKDFFPDPMHLASYGSPVSFRSALGVGTGRNSTNQRNFGSDRASHAT